MEEMFEVNDNDGGVSRDYFDMFNFKANSFNICKGFKACRYWIVVKDPRVHSVNVD